jgi:hypothetical protein
MSLTKISSLLTCAALTSMLAGIGGGTATAGVSLVVPGVAPPGVPAFGFKDEAGNVTSAPGDGITPFSACTPVSGRDNPHYSSPDVSGHAWWNKGTCSGTLADVYNCLYEWYTDNYWYRKGCSPKVRVYAGGGSANRSTARNTCANTQWASWRNYVDVDVVNESDTGEQPFNQADVACQVY